LTVANSSGALPTNPSATSCGGFVITGTTGSSSSHMADSSFPYKRTSTVLQSGTTYYRRAHVRHTNSTKGEVSNIRRFTTAGSLLAASSLISSGDAASGLLSIPTFSWSSVGGADRYWLPMATSSGALLF
jgi:hypothetical protein